VKEAGWSCREFESWKRKWQCAHVFFTQSFPNSNYRFPTFITAQGYGFWQTGRLHM